MDEVKRGKVVQMIAEAQVEAEKRSKSTASKKYPSPKSTKQKNGGVELFYIKLESDTGLVDALNAITQRKPRE